MLDVGAGIVEAYLDRADVGFDIGEQFLDVGFLAGIDAERVRLEPCGLQFVDQRLRFGGVAPADADRVTALGKSPRHGCADGVACADQYCYAATFRHVHPYKFLFDT